MAFYDCKLLCFNASSSCPHLSFEFTSNTANDLVVSKNHCILPYSFLPSAPISTFIWTSSVAKGTELLLASYHVRCCMVHLVRGCQISRAITLCRTKRINLFIYCLYEHFYASIMLGAFERRRAQVLMNQLHQSGGGEMRLHVSSSELQLFVSDAYRGKAVARLFTFFAERTSFA